MAFPSAFFVAAAVPCLSSCLPFPQGSRFLVCYLAATVGKLSSVGGYLAKLVLRNITEGGSQGADLPALALLGALGDALFSQGGFSEGVVVLLGVSGLFWVTQKA